MAAPSAHAIGLAFETHVLRFLNNDLRMALSHVGRSADGGIDLRGYWWLPKPSRSMASSSSSSLSSLSDETRAKRPVKPPGLAKVGTPGRRIAPLRILAQCKAERKAQGARVVRELEGVLGHLEHDVPTLGIVASQSGFSTLAMEHAQRSPQPLLLMYLEGGRPGRDEEQGPNPEDGPPQTIVAGAWWNAPFGALLRARGVEVRRELGKDGARLGVWYAGSRMGRYGPK